MNLRDLAEGEDKDLSAGELELSGNLTRWLAFGFAPLLRFESNWPIAGTKLLGCYMGASVIHAGSRRTMTAATAATHHADGATSSWGYGMVAPARTAF